MSQEDSMVWKLSVAVATALVVVAAVVPAAEAATRRTTTTAQAIPRQQTIYRYTDENGRRRTKIIVQRRSYLDAGTTVLPGQRKYSDYATRPFSQPFDVFGPGQSANDRHPLGPRWEFGGSQY
jgi:hypothetical protein